MPRLRGKDKTQEQLLKEMAQLRQRVAVLERTEKERQQAEEALRESEEELEAIFNEARDGIVLLDLTGKIIKINKRIAEVTGYTEKYIVGKRFNFFKNFPPQSVAKMVSAFTKTVAGQQVPPFEVVGYTKAGEKRIGEISGSLLRKKGKTVGVLVVMTDITERKQAENALRENQEHYRTLIDNIDLGITLMDVNHNIITVNAAQSKKFNKPASEMIGKKCFREFEKRDAVCPHCPGVQAMANHRSTEVETEGIRDDGSHFQTRIQAFPVLAQDGTVTGFIETAVDISKRKQAENALRESEERYRILVDNIDRGINLIDADHNIIFVNAAPSKNFNKPVNEMIGKKCFREFEKRDAVCPHCPGIQTMTTGRPAEVETEGVRDDGSRFQVRLQTFPVFGQDGTVTGFIETAVDISKRKQAENALRESEERYRILVDNIDRGINLIDADHNIIFVNAAPSKNFNKPVSEMIGKKCFREFEKRDAVCPHCPGIQTMITGRPAEVETEGVRDDGSRFQVRLQTFPVFGQDGKVNAFIEIAEDISERKLMENALRESEQKYRTILETMEEGYYESNPAGNFTFFNDAMCRIHGYTRDELMGMNNRAYTSPETTKRIYQIYSEVYKTGIPAKIVDYEVIKKDGSIAMVETSASLLRNAAGEPIGFYGVSRDRTEQKKAEVSLRQSEEKYRTILENIEDGYYEVDLAGNFTFFNDAVCRIHGYTRDELMGMNNRAYMDEETAKKVYNIFTNVFRTGKSTTINDWQIIRKDGSKIDFEASVSLIRDASGNPTGFRGIVRDITERKRAEEALRESEEKYRNILASIQEGYFETDLDGNYTFVNDANCRYLGYTRDELIGMNYRQHTEEKIVEKLYPHYMELYETGKPIESLEFEAVRKDGTKVIYETSVSLMRDLTGKPIGFRGVSRDITERKQAEETLREREERYRHILELAPDAITINRLTDGRYLQVNNAFCQHTGYSADEVLGRTPSDLNLYVDPADRERLVKAVRQDGRVDGLEISFRAKDGSILEDLVSARPIQFQGEDCQLVMATNINALKQAQEALRESEQKHRTILETMKEGYYETDLEGNFTFCNQALCEIFKCRHEDLVGLHYGAYLSPEGARKMYAIFHKVYKTGIPAPIIDYQLIRTDGSVAMIETSASLLRNAAGEPIGFYGVSRDRTEQKKAEEALRQSEEKYRTILETMEEGYYEVDLRGNITFFNEAECRIHRRSRDEMIGLNNRQFSSPETSKRIYAICNKVYRTGIPANIVDYEIIRKDGSIALLEASVSLLRNAAGKSIGFRGVTRDRTEQKKAEEALRQSEEKYRTILETIEEGYAEVDLRGNFVFVNETLCRIHGRSRHEMIGLSNRDYMTPETAKRIYKVFNKVYRTGLPVKAVDNEIIRKDGSIALLEESVSLLRNAAGKPIGFCGVSRDRTEQKKAEETLRQSEEKYRTILENIEDGYYEVDLAGNLTFFNDSICRIYGSTRDNMMGMNNRAYMDEETAKKTYRLFNQVYRTGEPAEIFDWEFIKEDGSIITVEMSVSLRRNSTGKPIGFRGIVRDITERKRAEEALRESEEKYRSLVEFTEDSVYLVNRKKEYLFANEAYLSRLGLPRDRVMGRPYSEFHSPEDDKVFSGYIEQVLKTGRFIQYEHRSQKDNRYFLRTLSPVKESDGHIEAVTVIAKDITERKRAEEELIYMATHDVLTGLPNRMLFNDRLTIALTQARRSRKKLAVMLLDLDYFKDVNDALGHGVGDQLLRAVGIRLRKLLRRGDTVARIGGDEFLLLLPEMLQIEYATTIAQKILQAFQAPFTFDDHKLQVSASIGITIYPNDGEDIDTLMKNADTVMYRAKDKGRGRFERYTS